MRSDSGGVIPERTHVEETCQDSNAEEGGGDREGGGGVVTYVVSFPWVLKAVIFPLPGCPAVAHSFGRMREHFMYRHFFSRIVVFEEGMETLPQRGGYSSTRGLSRATRTCRCGGGGRTSQLRADSRGRRSAS